MSFLRSFCAVMAVAASCGLTTHAQAQAIPQQVIIQVNRNNQGQPAAGQYVGLRRARTNPALPASVNNFYAQGYTSASGSIVFDNVPYVNISGDSNVFSILLSDCKLIQMNVPISIHDETDSSSGVPMPNVYLVETCPDQPRYQACRQFTPGFNLEAQSGNRVVLHSSLGSGYQNRHYVKNIFAPNLPPTDDTIFTYPANTGNVTVIHTAIRNADSCWGTARRTIDLQNPNPNNNIQLTGGILMGTPNYQDTVLVEAFSVDSSYYSASVVIDSADIANFFMLLPNDVNYKIRATSLGTSPAALDIIPTYSSWQILPPPATPDYPFGPLTWTNAYNVAPRIGGQVQASINLTWAMRHLDTTLPGPCQLRLRILTDGRPMRSVNGRITTMFTFRAEHARYAVISLSGDVIASGRFVNAGVDAYVAGLDTGTYILRIDVPRGPGYRKTIHLGATNMVGYTDVVVDANIDGLVDAVTANRPSLATETLVYPQPARQTLTVANNRMAGIHALALISAEGRAVITTRADFASRGKTTLRLPDSLAPGLYTLTLDGQAAGRVVVGR